jgi:hypothetical protein
VTPPRQNTGETPAGYWSVRFSSEAESLQGSASIFVATRKIIPVTTRYDDPTLTQMLSWGLIAAVAVVLLAYLFLSGVQYMLG